jgi:hypothetical protein
LFVALLAGSACTEKGRSLVLVRVTQSGLTGIGSGRVVVTRGGHRIGDASHAWSGDAVLKIGVYLPSDVTGTVNVVACAIATGGAVIDAASSPMDATATVSPGEASSEVALTLATGTASDFCTGGGMGGQGGGGGSTGGRGGAGGSTGGGGGTSGGTAGAGGGGTGGGLAGQSGTGGALAGRGGSAGGGTGGGGTAGTGGRWQGPHGIATEGTVTERFPSVAVDFNGNAVVVFEHNSDIYGSHYTFATDSWSPPTMIATGGNYEKPLVAVDGSAHYYVVWGPGMGATTLGVWQASSSDGINWNTTLPMVTSDDALKPVMAMNSDGFAVIAWSERLASNFQRVVACQRTASGSLAQIAVAHPADSASDLYPAVAISKVGEMFVTWEGSDGAPSNSQTSVWMKQFKNNQWQPEFLFETYNDNEAYRPSIATNGNSDAIVTYLQWTQTATSKELWSRRYTGGTWAQTPLRVRSSADIDAAQPPSIHLDDNGVATAAWSAASSQGIYSVEMSHLGAGDTAWGTPTVEGTPNYAGTDTNGTQSPMPVVRGDGNGNGIVVWRKRPATGTARFDLFAVRFAGGYWSVEGKIETIDMVGTATVNVFNPVLGMNGSGVAVAAWYNGGTNAPVDVYANIFR